MDTNVLVAGLRSRLGASHRLLQLVGTGKFNLILTVPLVLEYEDALNRDSQIHGLESEDVGAVLDYLCAVGEHHEVFFLWRPFLRDPGDDMVLEAAVEGDCQTIVTQNVKDFSGIEKFGLKAIRPGAFLRELEGGK